MTGRRAFLVGLAALPLFAGDESIPSPIPLIERRVFDAINFQRVAADSEPLRWSPELCLTAREHSRRMLEAGFFGHNDPTYGDLAARLNRARIEWLRCAENVFRENGYQDPVSIAVVHWMYSEGHRRNLLLPAYTLSGVGVAIDVTRTTAITQQFILPMQEPVHRRLRHD